MNETTLEPGMKIEVDFRFPNEEEKIDSGRLVGEISPEFWVVKFETSGLMVCGIERYGDIGFEGDYPFESDDLLVNPANPEDYLDEEMVIMLQIAAGELYRIPQPNEGGLFKVVKIEEAIKWTC